jgi:hypothetical protein
MRRSIWLFFALCTLAALATSEAAGPVSLYGSEARVSCVAHADPLAAVLAPQNRTNCLEGASCMISQNCADLCSGFATATCVDGQCQYTYGGGSGGSGGTGGETGCNIPEPMGCESFEQCVCQRPSGIYDYGQCINGSCQF